MRALLCVLALGCSGQQTPTREQLMAACPSAARVAAVDCPAIAIAKCDGYASLAECPNGDSAQAECDARIDQELAACH